MNKLLLTLLLLISLPSPGKTNLEGFFGLPWNTPKDVVIKMTGAEELSPNLLYRKTKLSTKEVELFYAFHENKLIAVEIQAEKDPGEDSVEFCNRVKNNFSEKFGKPDGFEDEYTMIWLAGKDTHVRMMCLEGRIAQAFMSKNHFPAPEVKKTNPPKVQGLMDL